MGRACEEHGVKLLTYGTLVGDFRPLCVLWLTSTKCGGFIADKWLGQPEPELFSNNITPSQRKVLPLGTTFGIING